MTIAAPRPEELAPERTSAPLRFGLAGTAREEFAARIAELGGLADGWDSYGARAIDRRALRVGQMIAERALTLTLPLPRLLAVPSGGVQVEWSVGPVDLELEIEPGGAAAIFICDDEYTAQRIDGELPADQGLFNLALGRLAAHA